VDLIGAAGGREGWEIAVPRDERVAQFQEPGALRACENVLRVHYDERTLKSAHRVEFVCSAADFQYP
jgi:hypothetical protein